MTKEKRDKNILLFVIAIILGATLPFANFSYLLFHFILAITVACIAFLVFVFSLFKIQMRKKAHIIGLAFILFISSAYGSEIIVHSYKRNIAEKIISKLENYKSAHNIYPTELNVIGMGNELIGLDYNSWDDSYRIDLCEVNIFCQRYEAYTRTWTTLSCLD